MSLLEACQEYFGSSDLYFILGVSKDASESELKKAYRKVSLLCHPDKVPEDKKEEATRKFQIVSKIHSILSDQEQRAVYDDTGCIDEENIHIEDKDWNSYWRLIFPKITKRDIEDFMKKYKGSDEEIEDLKKCYIEHEGDMNKISESFLGYTVDEEEKYQDILKDLIKNKEIPDFPKFSKETKAKKKGRIARFKKEAAEVESEEGNEQSLIDVIAQRSAQRKSAFDDMISSLEAKYAQSGGKKKKRK